MRELLDEISGDWEEGLVLMEEREGGSVTVIVHCSVLVEALVLVEDMLAVVEGDVVVVM